MIDKNLRMASEAWCPLVRPDNLVFHYESGELVINYYNCCIGSRCAMWSISHDKDGEEIGGVCGAALTGQMLSDG